MPVINIEYDPEVVPNGDMQWLSDGMHEVVAKVTDIDDVPVYAHVADVRTAIAPIEMFIRLSSQKITDPGALTHELKAALLNWKKEQNYPHKINMTLIPMDWNIEIDI